MDLTVVVVSFDTRAHLARALASVFADGAGLALEVVVVDNASTDGSAEAVRRDFPAARLVTNDANRYYAAANNQGFALARGRYVLVLNPDAEVRPGTLPALVAALDARPEVGVASPRMTWPDGRVQRNCAAERTFGDVLLEHTPLGLLLPWWRAGRRERAWYGDWDRESEREVGVLPGACLLIRRTVLEEVGGFDETLVHYFGEDDLCARVRQAGHGVRYVPVGAVAHEEGASARRRPRAVRRLYFGDLARFARKRFGPGRARLLAVLAGPMRAGLDVAGRLRGESA